MHKPLVFGLVSLASAVSFHAMAQEVLPVTVTGVENGKPIPAKFAFCMPDGQGRTTDGENISPQIVWTAAPAGTKSFAVLVVDKDVPASFESANKDGKTILDNYPRQEFYHWVLVDIPVGIKSLDEGIDSKGITHGGKPHGKTAYGISGKNDFALKADMGNGGGYDGPCPPWNDERLHRYYFRVFALDVETLGLSGGFGGREAEAAMKGHILAQGEVMGTFTNHQPVK